MKKNTILPIIYVITPNIDRCTIEQDSAKSNKVIFEQDSAKFNKVIFDGFHIKYNENTLYYMCRFINCDFDNFVKDVMFEYCDFEKCCFNFRNRKEVAFYKCAFKDVTFTNDNSSPTDEMVYMEDCDTSNILFTDGDKTNRIMRYVFISSYILNPLCFEVCKILDCDVVVKNDENDEIKRTILNKCRVEVSYIDDVNLEVLNSDIKYSEFFRGNIVNNIGSFEKCIYLNTKMPLSILTSSMSGYKLCGICNNYYHNVCVSCIKPHLVDHLNQHINVVEVCMIIEGYYDTTPRDIEID